MDLKSLVSGEYNKLLLEAENAAKRLPNVESYRNFFQILALLLIGAAVVMVIYNLVSIALYLLLITVVCGLISLKWQVTLHSLEATVNLAGSVKSLVESAVKDIQTQIIKDAGSLFLDKVRGIDESLDLTSQEAISLLPSGTTEVKVDD